MTDDQLNKILQQEFNVKQADKEILARFKELLHNDPVIQEILERWIEPLEDSAT